MVGNGAHLLLLHELRVWAIVDHVRTENWRGERGIDLLGVHILKFAIKNELVALCPEINSCLLSEENESEDIAILLHISRCS
jgi:hypothetical protein